MLVLSRKLGETIKIGDSIELKIVGIENNQVRVGIEAPKEIKILREEIQKNIKHP